MEEINMYAVPRGAGWIRAQSSLSDEAALFAFGASAVILRSVGDTLSLRRSRLCLVLFSTSEINSAQVPAAVNNLPPAGGAYPRGPPERRSAAADAIISIPFIPASHQAALRCLPCICRASAGPHNWTTERPRGFDGKFKIQDSTFFCWSPWGN